ncbi:MAG: domain containing protein [Gemmatimonadetes bacterium]|nr:domain containing protein [Gemmatimonadota bacterium]
MVLAMGNAYGVMMQRVLGVVAAAMLVSMNGAIAAGSREGSSENVAPVDITALLTAAHGAPPLICALASQAVRGYGWGDWNDAPASPLSGVAPVRSRDINESRLSTEDMDKLLTALASDDACVRELSVRLLAGTRNDGSTNREMIANALVTRLRSPDVPMREVATFALGLIGPISALDPLIATLRDANAGIRANAAWALGRIDNGKALAPIVTLFRDSDLRVREAAVVAAGHIDSVSTIPALMRVLQNDEAPSVRRVAAWALGQKGAREAADVLATQLGKEGDARVREMIAWALAETGARSGTAALTSALRRDSDDNVRETAAWALAELGDRSAVDALGSAAESDRSSRVRGTAAWAIGQLHGNGTKAPSGLVKVLKDDSDDARLKAAWALGQVGDASVINDIRDALKVEKSSQVRRGLIRALIKSGGRSEETLTELLSSTDATVREAAVRGLAGNNSFNPWPWPWPRPRPFP